MSDDHDERRESNENRDSETAGINWNRVFVSTFLILISLIILAAGFAVTDFMLEAILGSGAAATAATAVGKTTG